MGTGGALKFAEDLLDDRFLMLNGDVLTDIDLTRAARAARAHRARVATLALYPVEDPSAYGLVRLDGDGSVTEFVEKPAPDQIDTNNISAGAYVLERSVLSLLEKGAPASIERDVFPRLVGNGLFGHVSQRVLEGHRDARALPRGDLRHPRGHRRTPRSRRGWARRSCASRTASRTRRADRSRRRWSRATAGSATGARIGGRAVLEHGVRVGEGTTIESSVVMQGAEIGAHCTLRGCIVAAGAQIGDHCVIDGMSVIGEGVVLGADNVVSNGARLFPGVTLPDGALRF